MEKSEYEKLINQGYRIIRFHRGNIQIKVKKANWTKVCAYSIIRWEELMANKKTIADY